MTERLDLLAIGETMAMVTSSHGERLAEDASLVLRAAGAESNVAVSASHLGLRSGWFSALGEDPLGDAVLRQVAEHGVDTRWVLRDPNRPTGVMFKDPRPEGRSVFYYRRDSAASALSAASLPSAPIMTAATVHVSGISAALSRSCDELLDAVVVDRALDDALVSFDVNYRRDLWADGAADRLLSLSRAADVVFVGLDEAEELWGARTPADVAALIGAGVELVVKDGGRAATSFVDGRTDRVPAHEIKVVDVVGAGDAFAAGWLAARHRGSEPETRLASGHAAAARVLLSTSDVPDAAAALEAAAARTTATRT